MDEIHRVEFTYKAHKKKSVCLRHTPLKLLEVKSNGLR